MGVDVIDRFWDFYLVDDDEIVIDKFFFKWGIDKGREFGDVVFVVLKFIGVFRGR